jgi:hypothetical protein
LRQSFKTKLKQLWFPAVFRLPEPEFTKEQLDLLEELIQLIQPTLSREEKATSDERVSMARFLIDLGTGVWRIRRKIEGLSRMPKEIKDALYSLESTWASMSAGGVEIVDHTGTIPLKNEAKIIEVREIPNLTRDQVIETIKPTIILRGEIIQVGEVVMGCMAKPSQLQASSSSETDILQTAALETRDDSESGSMIAQEGIRQEAPELPDDEAETAEEPDAPETPDEGDESLAASEDVVLDLPGEPETDSALPEEIPAPDEADAAEETDAPETPDEGDESLAASEDDVQDLPGEPETDSALPEEVPAPDEADAAEEPDAPVEPAETLEAEEISGGPDEPEETLEPAESVDEVPEEALDVNVEAQEAGEEPLETREPAEPTETLETAETEAETLAADEPVLTAETAPEEKPKKKRAPRKPKAPAAEKIGETDKADKEPKPKKARRTKKKAEETTEVNDVG